MDTPSQNASPGFLTENLQILSSAAAPVNVEMVLRVWSPSPRSGDSTTAESTTAHYPGLLAFIEDLAASKQGTVQTARNQLSVSGLKQPADALVIARRIQIGLQGFRGAHDHASVAVSIAIDAGNQRAPSVRPDTGATASIENNPASTTVQTRTISEPSHDLLTLLKISKPAQVLLTHDLCQRSAAIKGLPLKSFPARFGVYEYLWTSQEKLDQLQCEPQLTLTAVSPAPPAAPEQKIASEPAARTVASAPTVVPDIPPSPIARTKIVWDWRAALRSPRVAVFAGLAVAVIGIGTFVGVRLAHDSHPQPRTDPNPPTNRKPPQEKAKPQNPGENANGGSETQSSKDKPTGQQKPHKTAQEKHLADSQKPSAVCTLTGELSPYVALAEQARGRGDYANSIRRFRAILACDPNNGAAQQGLNRALQGQAQNR